MKLIGLIGGMSWNSTLAYYRIINELVSQRLGGFHSAPLVLYSLDFDAIEVAQREARWDDAAHILAEAGSALRQAGADFLVICTNTMHRVADVVSKEAGLPVLNIVDVTGNAIRELGLRKIGLLGTRFVMEEPFYRERLRKRFDVEVLVPGEQDMHTIHRIIYEELCEGTIKDSSRRACVNSINGLMQEGAEGIVLGCTELPLLIGSGDVDVPLFDTTRLHAEAAVDLALAEG
jgi:aspartate racemase